MHLHDILELHWGIWVYVIVFWLLLILGIVAIIKWFNAKTRLEQTSFEILKKRCEKGEISKEDLDRIREKIQGGGD